MLQKIIKIEDISKIAIATSESIILYSIFSLNLGTSKDSIKIKAKAKAP
jgi:hypothetical protein